MWRSMAIVLIFAGTALAATTAPSTQPAIGQWFAGLASPDADQREQSRTNLLGLSRSDLPQLRELVQKNQPLAPAQTAALHDIVVHLYLSGEHYESDASTGFLGLWWPGADLLAPPRLGVPVEERVPGFGGFQKLREGDLILGVLIWPDAPLQQLPNLVTPNYKVLTDAIQAAGANRDIVLEVLRQGERIRIPVHLRPKPTLPDVTEWEQRGEDYWKAQFLPLLQTGVS
jgi:hypothetical protein